MFKRRYSYFKPNSKIASRIDPWAIINSLDPSVIKTSIVQTMKTDHASTILKLKSSTCERGPGYWKMNDMVINSVLFYNVFTTFWKK